jgi:hypothetical protein
VAKFSELIFKHGCGDRDEAETPMRGYRDDVLVKLDDGRTYRVTFYDPVRLHQTLEDEAGLGVNYFAEPGLIVVQRVDREGMERAARELALSDFFSYLRPVDG